MRTAKIGPSIYKAYLDLEDYHKNDYEYSHRSYYSGRSVNFDQAFSSFIHAPFAISLFNPKDVDFWWLSTEEIQTVQAYLDGNFQVGTIEIYLTYFSPQNMEKILCNLPNLQKLALNYNGNNPSKYRESLFNVLNSNTKISHLDLRNMKTISVEDLESLNEVLRSSSSLVDLELEIKKINLEKIKALCALLKGNQIIKTFTLKTNELDKDCLRHLADTCNLTNLSKVSFVCNSFDRVGLYEFTQILKGNQSLRHLEIFDLNFQEKRMKAESHSGWDKEGWALIALGLHCIQTIAENTLITRIETNYSIYHERTKRIGADSYTLRAIRSFLERNSETRKTLSARPSENITVASAGVLAPMDSVPAKPSVPPPSSLLKKTAPAPISNTSSNSFVPAMAGPSDADEDLNIAVAQISQDIADMRPYVEFVASSLNENPFGLSEDVADLNLLYRLLFIYINNLFTGAAAVASGVSKRASYTLGDAVKGFLSSLVKAAPVIGEILASLFTSEDTGKGIKRVADGLAVAEVLESVIPASLKEAISQKFFHSQRDKLTEFTELCHNDMKRTALIMPIAITLVKIHREPVLNAGLTTDGLRMLAAQMVMRIFFSVKNGLIDGSPGALVADVICNPLSFFEKISPRFSQRLETKDKSRRITARDVLSCSGLRWKNNANEWFTSVIADAEKCRATTLGFKELPEEIVKILFKDENPFAWNPPQPVPTRVAPAAGTTTAKRIEKLGLLAEIRARTGTPVESHVVEDSRVGVSVRPSEPRSEVAIPGHASGLSESEIRVQAKLLLDGTLALQRDKREANREYDTIIYQQLDEQQAILADLNQLSDAPITAPWALNYFEQYLTTEIASLLLKMYAMRTNRSDRIAKRTNHRVNCREMNGIELLGSFNENTNALFEKVVAVSQEDDLTTVVKSIQNISKQCAVHIYTHVKPLYQALFDFESKRNFAQACISRMLSHFTNPAVRGLELPHATIPELFWLSVLVGSSREDALALTLKGTPQTQSNVGALLSVDIQVPEHNILFRRNNDEVKPNLFIEGGEFEYQAIEQVRHVLLVEYFEVGVRQVSRCSVM